jgi:hypothetical protein
LKNNFGCDLLGSLPKQGKEMAKTNISTDGTSQFIANKKKKRLRLLSTLSGKQTMIYGLIGAVLFFGLWEVTHLMTAEEAKRFLPSPFSVAQALITLIQEKNFMADVSISAYRIFGSFFIASLIAIPIGLLMGCLERVFRQKHHNLMANPAVGVNLSVVMWIVKRVTWMQPESCSAMFTTKQESQIQRFRPKTASILRSLNGWGSKASTRPMTQIDGLAVYLSNQEQKNKPVRMHRAGALAARAFAIA